MKTQNTLEQKQAISNLMRKLRASQRNTGPRRFPAFKPGMSTAEYVRRYFDMNNESLHISCFALNFEPCELPGGPEVEVCEVQS